MQRINKLIQSRVWLASSGSASSASLAPSLTIRRASHLAHAVQLNQCANRSISTNNVLRTLTSSNHLATSTIASTLAPFRQFSTSSSSTPPTSTSSATSNSSNSNSKNDNDNSNSMMQPLRITVLVILAVLCFNRAREVWDPEYAAERKNRGPGRLSVITSAVIEANERYEIERAARIALKQKGQQEKHIKGERKSGALVQSPDAAPIIPVAVAPVAASVDDSKTPSSAAAPAATPASNDPYDPECRVCRSGGEQTDINAFYRNQSQSAFAASNAASEFALNPSAPAASCPPCYAYSHSLCPLNRAEVGRAAWGYLHTIAAYYPASPSERQQNDMAQFLHLFMKLYPCGYCADRSMEQLEREPIEKYVASQEALNGWMCRLHNEVNERLGKPIFQCEYSNARWRDGPPTGECD